MAFLLFFLLLSQQAPENPRDLQALVETTAGTFTLQFYPDNAPNHVAKFIERARRGDYNGTTFYSMVPHGIVQGGDPETRVAANRAKFGTGGFNGGLRAEITTLPFKQGTVFATTLPGEPDSAGSQFTLVVTDQLQFTGQFTAFAYVADGIDVVDRLSTTPTDENHMATERVEIRSITVRKIPPPPPPPFSQESVDELKQYQVVMETSKGTITIEMLPDKAPNHVRHFLRLASVGAYDQTTFHRIAPGFVIQAGDLNTRGQPMTPSAHQWVVNIGAEINDVKHQAGIVSLARGEALDSGLTSFFIVLGDQPALDGVYTVFGRVSAGMDVVKKIEAVPNDNEKPLERVEVYSVKAVRKN